MQRAAVLLFAIIFAIVLAVPGSAQDDRRPTNLGSETGNFGLAPYQPIPTYTLTDAQKSKVRALEDKQVQERRALEDKFAAELKALLVRQSQERSSLLATLDVQ